MSALCQTPPDQRSDYAAVDAHVRRLDGTFNGRFKGLCIGSAFQPIYSLAHRRAVGYEALMRATAHDGTDVSPRAIFGSIGDEAETVFLDRLCRTVHLGNFMAAGDTQSWLFLNVSPEVVVRGRKHGSFFRDLLATHQIPGHRVVVEILEGQIDGDQHLAEMVEFYKGLGCLVAIDDFGAGHSNFDRIWKVSPHIVKFDRSMIAQAVTDPRVRHVLPSLVNLIHETGSLALMEGVETTDEALIAVDAGFDLVQGYYFGRPGRIEAPSPSPSPAMADTIAELHERSGLRSETEAQNYRQQLAAYEERFKEAALRVAAGVPMEEACASLLAAPRAERCYRLDADGRQIGDNVLPPGWRIRTDPRFTPLADGSGAVWSRRHYFRRALGRPGEMQTTRPYLSVAGANMCITLSIALPIDGCLVVFCCDLDWS